MKLSAVLLFCFVAALEVSPSVTQKYGSPCSSTQRCDSRSGTISCSTENVCGCADPQTMIYDEEQDVCVGRLDTMCYTRPLRNRHVRNCVAGATCVPVSSVSVFGICQVAQANPEMDETEDEEVENDDTFVENTTGEIETTAGDAATASTGSGGDDGPTTSNPGDDGPTTSNPGDDDSTSPDGNDPEDPAPGPDGAASVSITVSLLGVVSMVLLVNKL